MRAVRCLKRFQAKSSIFRAEQPHLQFSISVMKASSRRKLGMLWNTLPDQGSGLILNDLLFSWNISSWGLFCFPRERFDYLELCQCICDPAVLFLLSFYDPFCGSTLQVEKLGVSFEYCLALRAVGQHHGYCWILFEVSITGCRLVHSKIEDSFDIHEVCG